MKAYHDITYKYFKIQKKRTLLTILGIVLSVALITAIGTMLISMQEKLIRDAIKDNGDYHAIFRKVPGNKVNKIRNNMEIGDSAVIRKEGYAILGSISPKIRALTPEDPPYQYLSIKNYDQKALALFPIKLKAGRLPKNEKEIALDFWALDNLPTKFKVGDKIKFPVGLRLDQSSKLMPDDTTWSSSEVFIPKSTKEYTVVGLIMPKFIWSDNRIAEGITQFNSQKLLSEKEYNVYVKFNNVKGVQAKAENIAAGLSLSKVKAEDGSLKYQIQYNDRLLRLSAESLNTVLNTSLIGILCFIILLIMVSTIAVIYNAFNISVLERIAQFGVLRCIGASPSQIKKVVFKEAGLLCLISIPLGLGTGILAMKLVMVFIGMFNLTNQVFDDIKIVISPQVFMISSCLGLLTVYLSAYGPARQAAKVSPLDAVRNTGGYRKESFKGIKNSRLARIVFGVEGQIAYKNLRRNRKRFRITIFSMVISIILYIVFSSFVDFVFKASTYKMTSDPDFILNMNSSDQMGFSQKKFKEVNSLPGVDKAYKYLMENGSILVPKNKINPHFAELKDEVFRNKKGDMTILDNCTLRSYGDSALQELKKNLKEGQIDFNELNKENGIILLQTNQFYDQKHRRNIIIDNVSFKVGDKIPFAVYGREDGTKGPQYKTVKVLGIVDKGILSEEYNLNEGVSFVTTEKVYKSIIGNNDYSQISVIMKKDADREAIRKYLKTAKEQDPRFQYTDISEIAEENEKLGTVISIFLYGFVGVITLIGCLNIINTISTNLLLRTRELSVLKTIGMTKGSISKMVGLEGIYYGIIAAIYGGILGTILSYVLFRLIIKVTEFTWSMPWKHIIIAVLGSTLVALISGYIPLRRINKGNLIDGIQGVE